MSQAKLKHQLKTNQFDNVLVFFGQEDYLREYYLNQVINKLVEKDFFEFNFHQFNASQMDVQLFSLTAGSYPAMAQKRVIVINDLTAQSFKGELKAELEALFSDFPEFLVLIFNYTDNQYKPDKKEELKKLFKDALIVDFEKPKENDLCVWIIKNFNSRGKKLKHDTALYFLSVCPNEMNIMKNEIEKICNFTKDDEISERDIDDLCTKSLDASVFSLGDALLSKQYDKAYGLLDTLILQKEQPVAILAYLSSVFINLFKLKCANIEGLGFDYAVNKMGMNRYAAGKCQKHLARYDKSFIKNIIKQCKNTDIELKSSRVDKNDILYILIGKIISLSERV